MQILIFKALFSLFQYNPSGYYYFKSLVLAIFSTSYFFFLFRYLRNVTVAVWSAFFIGLAASTFTSLMWVSDFVLVTEFLALLVYAIFLNLEIRPKRNGTAFHVSLVLMIVLTLLCDRTKANGKLIPAILFAYVLLSDRRKFRTYGPAIAVMLILVLPWKVLIDNPAPFLFAKSGPVHAYAWQPASVSQFWRLFGGDFEPLSVLYSAHPPISVLGIIGFPLLYACIISIIIVLKRQRVHAGKMIRFLIVWAAVNAAALMSYPFLPAHFQARYAISVLTPLVPLLLLTMYNAAELTWKRAKVAEVLVVALVLIQIGFHGYHTFRTRNDFPTLMIASDTLREYIAQNFKDTWFFYLNSPVIVFRPTHDGNRFFTSLEDDINNVASNRPLNADLYVISFFPLNESFLELPVAFPGKSGGLYDRIFNRGKSSFYKYTFYLYKVKTGT